MSKKPINVADITATSGMSAFSKWVPLICAGAAVGVSVLALKEIKNLRKELIIMKKESLSGPTADDGLSKQVERMDEQLRKITEYLVKQKKVKESNNVEKQKEPNFVSQQKESKVVRNVSPEPEVNVVNGSDDEEEVEYVEVTDDDE